MKIKRADIYLYIQLSYADSESLKQYKVSIKNLAVFYEKDLLK